MNSKNLVNNDGKYNLKQMIINIVEIKKLKINEIFS